MMTPEDIKRYRRNRKDEIDSATVYTAMADAESQPQIADVYRRLADTERAHADFWTEKIREAGSDPGEANPSRRARVLAWLARRFGPGIVLSSMQAGEAIGGNDYATQPEVTGTGMAADERSHDRLLTVIAETPGQGHGERTSPSSKAATGRPAATHSGPQFSMRTTVWFPT